MKFRGM
jgi:hypothetical protein